MFRNDKKLGEMLVESGFLTGEQLDSVLRSQVTKRVKLGELVVEQGYCSEPDIALALSSQLGLLYVDLRNTPVEPMAVDMIAERIARKHLIVPLAVEEKTLHVAMADPTSFEALNDLRFASGHVIRPAVATKTDVLWAIDHHYNLGSSIDDLLGGLTAGKHIEVVREVGDTQLEVDDLKRRSETAPIIRIVNLLISEAVDLNASDIHVEPAKDKLVIRNRVDGMLRIHMELPRWVQGAVISRLKIMANLDIAEKRLPQDGRIGVRVGGRLLDIRLSSLPTIYGEKIVMRILDPAKVLLSVKDLGLGEGELSQFMSLIERPQGIVLVTGPTGSGKTTSLYAALSEINSPELNISTIEDPVEYELPGISQVAIHEKIGLTFASFLRSILRQDPDVVMVGEMRDLETATIAMQASLTGHLVLSTIHTNNAVATITRLRNIGIPSFLIASTISGIIAQRLVRLLCPTCKAPDDGPRDRLAGLGVNPSSASGVTLYRPVGCKECGGSGYRGRKGLYEILMMTRRVRDLVTNNATETDITKAALEDGMRFLSQAGLEKILAGSTSIDEVLRVAGTDESYAALCPSCGTSLSADFIGCPHCNRPIVDHCPRCKRSRDPQWRFCPYCRLELASAAAATPKVAPRK